MARARRVVVFIVVQARISKVQLNRRRMSGVADVTVHVVVQTHDLRKQQRPGH